MRAATQPAVPASTPRQPERNAAAYTALRDALLARHCPADAIERHWVEELAWAAARLRRLRALEDRALDAALLPVRGGTIEPEIGLSLPALARLRARAERDHCLALAELERLKASRPRPPAAASAARLRWLADRAEAATGGLGTNDPEPARPAAMQRPRCTVTPV